MSFPTPAYARSGQYFVGNQRIDLPPFLLREFDAGEEQFFEVRRP
jgi:hypothetical protein